MAIYQVNLNLFHNDSNEEFIQNFQSILLTYCKGFNNIYQPNLGKYIQEE